mmetsp:Transcript_58668/g.187066  ORF Transcript_58668/g.187066 Transcript_58668/m.187066 type:complete len:257 (-) Transcript_58668:576-1346(-)
MAWVWKQGLEVSAARSGVLIFAASSYETSAHGLAFVAGGEDVGIDPALPYHGGREHCRAHGYQLLAHGRGGHEGEVRGLVEEAEDAPHGLDEPCKHARHVVRDVLGHVGVVREHERNGAHLGVQERGKAHEARGAAMDEVGVERFHLVVDAGAHGQRERQGVEWEHKALGLKDLRPTELLGLVVAVGGDYEDLVAPLAEVSDEVLEAVLVPADVREGGRLDEYADAALGDGVVVDWARRFLLIKVIQGHTDARRGG